jgi:cytochrome c556
MSNRNVRMAIIGGTFAAGLVSIAHADVIEDRQQAMKNVGDAMKKLAAIAKKEAEFDLGAIKAHTDVITDRLTKVKDLFPPDSQTGGDTAALPTIWEDPAGFEAARTRALELVGKVAAVGDEAAFGAALKELGENGCGGCHGKFRKKEE